METGDGVQPRSHLTTEIEHDFLKIFSTHVVPEGQLADTPEAVDTQHRRAVFENRNL
jgi:hypothetical protein